MRKLLTTRASIELNAKLSTWCSGRTKKRKTHGVRSLDAIISSMAQAKRAFAPLGPEFIQASLEKHSILLSSVASTDSGLKEEIQDYIKDLFPQNWAQRWNDQETLERGLTNRSISNGLTVRYPDPREDYIPSSTLVKTGPGKAHVIGRYHDRYAEWYRDCDDFNVKAVGVQDAGKIRVITKSIKELKVLQPLQYALHTHLKSHFPLMGRTLELADLQEVVDDMRPDEEPVSVDYEGATDSLHGDFQKELIETIIDRSGSWRLQALREIAGRELSLGRVIEYPDRSIRQRRGTLMGSLLSFPLLCALNSFVLRRAGCRKVIVNGDDGFTTMSKSMYNDWLSACKGVGLVVNNDKTYRSRNYVTINSRYFRISRTNEVHEIPVVVQGFFQSILDGRNFDSIHQRYRRIDLFKSYSKYRPSDLRPLGIPRCLGGLGGDISTAVEPREPSAKDWRSALGHWLLMKPLDLLQRDRRGVTDVDGTFYDNVASRLQTWSLLEEGFLEEPLRPIPCRNLRRLGTDEAIMKRVMREMSPRFGTRR